MNSRRIAIRALPANREHGFSLLEIMVVVVIIGIMVALTTISIGTLDEDGVGEHSRRLEALLGLALEDAMMQSREIGLTFYQHGYEFSVRETGVDKDGNTYWIWTPLSGDEMLRSRDLGEDITVELELDGDEVVLQFEREEEDEDEENNFVPQVLLMSSGDIEPTFSVLIRRSFSSDGTRLDVNVFGEVETVYEE